MEEEVPEKGKCTTLVLVEFSDFFIGKLLEEVSNPVKIGPTASSR